MGSRLFVLASWLLTIHLSGPKRPQECSLGLKNDVPTRAVYFTNEFLIMIQIRYEMHVCNLAAGFCAVHNNPSVAKT